MTIIEVCQYCDYQIVWDNLPPDSVGYSYLLKDGSKGRMETFLTKAPRSMWQHELQHSKEEKERDLGQIR